MSEEELKAEIAELEEQVEFLYQRGSNDEEVNSRLRELRSKLIK